VLLVVLATAWAVWQPARADTLTQDALDALARGDEAAALDQARQARDDDPHSQDPLYAVATIQQRAGRNSEAGAALQEAVRLQPENPDPWLRLATFEFNTLHRPAAALKAIRPALYLDPRSSDAVAVFLAAQRQASAP
jgi:Flp pilus assembly protein TadD